MEFQDGRFGPRFILFRDRLNNNTHWTSLGLKGDTAYLYDAVRFIRETQTQAKKKTNNTARYHCEELLGFIQSEVSIWTGTRYHNGKTLCNDMEKLSDKEL